MISVAIIAVSVVGVGILLTFATERKYSRLRQQEKERAIKDAEAKLLEARRNHPQDILLHATLRDTLKRLRDE
jgi:hypothetical protein